MRAPDPPWGESGSESRICLRLWDRSHAVSSFGQMAKRGGLLFQPIAFPYPAYEPNPSRSPYEKPVYWKRTACGPDQEILRIMGSA